MQQAEFMSTDSNDIVRHRSVFFGIALATGLVLLIPLIAMAFTDRVAWGALDFIVAGCLLFGTGSSFVLVARKVPRRHRGAIGGVFALALLYVWAELAVGIFTNLGS